MLKETETDEIMGFFVTFFASVAFQLEVTPWTVADIVGGTGGMHPPPTSLKVTILAEKSASISNNSPPFRDASPPPAAT